MKIMVVMALAISLVACKTAGNKNTDDIDTLKSRDVNVDTTSSQLSPARRDTLVLYQDRRDKTQVAIDEIRTRVANGELKEDLKARSEELEEKLNQLNKKIDDLGRSSERSWNTLKLEIDSLLTDLDQTIDRTKNNLKK
jgi:malate synthase